MSPLDPGLFGISAPLCALAPSTPRLALRPPRRASYAKRALSSASPELTAVLWPTQVRSPRDVRIATSVRRTR